MLLFLIFLGGTLLLFYTVGYAMLVLTRNNLGALGGAFSDISIIGFHSLLVILALIHFISPIQITLSLGLIPLFLWFVIAPQRRKRFLQPLLEVKEAVKGKELLLIFFLLLIVFSGSATITYFDTGLYHLQNINWIKEYPLIKGLGNIHGRFAFNSHLFLVNGLNSYISPSAAALPTNAALYLLLVYRLYTFVKTEPSSAKKGVFYLCLVLSTLSFFYLFNSASTDVPVSLLTIYLLSLLFRFGSELNRHSFLVVLTICSTLFLIKVSAVFYLIAPVCIFIGQKKFKQLVFSKKFTTAVCISWLSIALLFCVRNVFLSGYVLYPLPELDFFSFAWEIPKERTEFERTYIQSWAKIRVRPAELVAEMSLTQWLPEWWFKQSIFYKALIALSCLSILSWFLQILKRKHHVNFNVIGFACVNLLFWFVMAPDPRFALGFFVFLTALFFYPMFNSFEALKRSKVTLRIAPVPILLFALLSIHLMRQDYSKISLKRLVWPQAIVEDKYQENATNFSFFYPTTDARCFNCALPCLPENRNDVVLIGKEMREGFKVKTSP
jgi:hypothetical protein